MFPIIHVPISRKVVLGFLTAAVASGLQTVGVYDLPTDVAAWVATGSGLAVAYGVPEGVKFLDYAAEKLGLKVVDFEDTP